MARPTSDFEYPGGKSAAGVPQWIVANLPPALFYCEPFAGRGGVFRHKPPAMVSWLNDSDCEAVAWWLARREYFRTERSLKVTHGCGIRLVQIAAQLGVRDLMFYCDQPYVLSTRVHRKLYKHELSDEQHGQLLEALVSLRCGAAVSGYDHPLYRSVLAGWRLEQREVITRGGTTRVECLWINQIADSMRAGLQSEYSDFGPDYRERERVAKKLRRWRSMFRAMPDYESRALLRELIEAANQRP